MEKKCFKRFHQRQFYISGRSSVCFLFRSLLNLSAKCEAIASNNDHKKVIKLVNKNRVKSSKTQQVLALDNIMLATVSLTRLT